jgi:hypothetical protein
MADPIKEAIRKMLPQEEIYSLECEVLSVNEDDRACDVRPLNGDPDIYDVRLQAELEGTTGVCLVPKVGSMVVVTFMSKHNGYIALCSKVEKVIIDCDSIVFNGGENGGLVIVQKLLEKINRLEERMLTHQHISTAPTNPTGPDAITNKPFLPTTLSDITNPKIKH